MKYTTEELNQTGIYAIINKVNGKKYIGSTATKFRKRWNQHKHLLRKGNHHSNYLQNSWNKYKESNFEFRIIEIVPEEEWTDNNYLLDIEQMYLDTFQPEYNTLPTAGSQLGYKHTEEARRKMSIAQKGNTNKKGKKGVKHTEETKLKMSLSQKGRIINEETKLKMSLAQMGKKHLDNSKMKMSISKRPQGYSFIHRETGEICIFHNLQQFCRERNLSQGNMSSVDRGDRNHHKGWMLYIAQK